MECCMGAILEVNLSTGEITKSKVPDAVYAQVLSGKGLGVWYLLRHIPDGADPLGPANVLGMLSGALTGSGALMTGRWMVVCKSPLTGGMGDANCGGYFSPAIKQCGVDGIFFRGVSEKPVYLYVDDTTAELRDASALWGLDAVESEQRLVAETRGDNPPRVAVIGTAGEKLSLISGVCHDGGRIAARSGVGAVMGSKRLKAVVLAGGQPIACAQPEAVARLNQKLARLFTAARLPQGFSGSLLAAGGALMGKIPLAFNTGGTILAPAVQKMGHHLQQRISGCQRGCAGQELGRHGPGCREIARAHNPDRYIARETEKYHCYACGLGCGGRLDTRDLNGGEFAHTHKPEYETAHAFGAALLNADLPAVLYINELLNRAGMDAISAGATLAFAFECYQQGLITPAGRRVGADLGQRQAIIALVKKMIAREGIGEHLADGVQTRGAHFGAASLPYAIHVGGQEAGMHDSR